MITEIAIATAVSAITGLLIVSHRLRKTRRNHSNELETSESRFRHELERAQNERNRMLDAIDDAFLLVNPKGNILFANSAARNLLANRNLIHRPVAEILLDAGLTTPLTTCLETRKPTQSQVTVPKRMYSGEDLESPGFYTWLINCAPLSPAEDGNPVTRVIIRDVTTERQTEQIRKDFVANASHELRTPMAIICGYLENLLDEDMLSDADSARHFLKIMRKHADRISRIIEDMLVISRLESGEANALKIRPFPLRGCVNDVLERLESVIKNQDADVRVSMPDVETIIHGDRFYWTQVLFNLIENALKQNPHPGLQIQIGCQPGEHHHEIWVSDNGVGIPSADLPHIFRRFFRVDKQHSQREIKGTGLGLSIVKRAIEAHGGSISVTSVPGHETRFLITIPNHIPDHPI